MTQELSEKAKRKLARRLRNEELVKEARFWLGKGSFAALSKGDHHFAVDQKTRMVTSRQTRKKK